MLLHGPFVFYFIHEMKFRIFLKFDFGPLLKAFPANMHSFSSLTEPAVLLVFDLRPRCFNILIIVLKLTFIVCVFMFRIIHYYVLREQAGTLAPPKSDMHKVSATMH